ncbi:MAG: A24 family peptidase [Candidatus Nanopelagicales bacterium]
MAISLFSAVLGAVVGYYAPHIAQRTTGLTIANKRAIYVFVTAVGAGLTAWGVGVRWTLVAWLWVALVGAILSFIDIEHHRLPDALTLPSYVVVAVALLLPALAYGQWDAYLRAWLGGLAMFAGYFLLALIYPAGMGMGDVKLAGILGLVLGYIGWAFVFVGFFAAFFVGAFVGIGLMLIGRAGRKTAIPFGPFMFVGALTALLFTVPLMRGLAAI